MAQIFVQDKAAHQRIGHYINRASAGDVTAWFRGGILSLLAGTHRPAEKPGELSV
jgi:hypothetical protein